MIYRNDDPRPPIQGKDLSPKARRNLIIAILAVLALILGAFAIGGAIQDRNEQQAIEQEWQEHDEYYEWLDQLPPEVQYYEMTKDIFIDRRHAMNFAYEVCDLLDDYYAEAVFEYMMNPRVTPGVQGTTSQERIEAMMIAPSRICPEHAAEVSSSVMDSLGIDMRPGG